MFGEHLHQVVAGYCWVNLFAVVIISNNLQITKVLGKLAMSLKPHTGHALSEEIVDYISRKGTMFYLKAIGGML